jgi:hypothetical protein
LLHSDGDACKGWFPDEHREISFSWKSLGLSSPPEKQIQVRIAP